MRRYNQPYRLTGYARDALRQAIGQLYDYRRFHQLPVGSPSRCRTGPNADGLALLHGAGIEAVWPHGTVFRDSARGTFPLSRVRSLRRTKLHSTTGDTFSTSCGDVKSPAV
jgi:hypothetical protein